MVNNSDKIRNPSDSFYQKSLITEFQNAKKVDSMLISIYSKKATDGQFKTLVKILKPKKDKTYTPAVLNLHPNLHPCR